MIAILTNTAKLVESVKYFAYGTPIALPAGDTDSGGDWDLTDQDRHHDVPGEFRASSGRALSEPVHRVMSGPLL